MKIIRPFSPTIGRLSEISVKKGEKYLEMENFDYIFVISK